MIDSAVEDKVLRRADAVCSDARAATANCDLQKIMLAIRDVAASADLNDAEGLHDVRIRLKKIRYALEVNGTDEAQPIIAELKAVHDAIGEWHDWVTLGEIARERFPARSPIVVEIKRASASLFVRALETASRFLKAYAVNKKKPQAAKAAAGAAQLRA